MARIPYATNPDATGELNLFRMLAHSPPVLEGFRHLGGALLAELSLSPRLREAAILRIGLLAGATYEVGKHLQIASWVGLTNQEIAALYPNGDATGLSPLAAGLSPLAAGLDPALRAIVRLADELHVGTRASDDTLRELRAHLTDRQVVEAVVTTGFYGMVCRVLETLGVDLEHPFGCSAAASAAGDTSASIAKIGEGDGNVVGMSVP